MIRNLLAALCLVAAGVLGYGYLFPAAPEVTSIDREQVWKDLRDYRDSLTTPTPSVMEGI